MANYATFIPIALLVALFLSFLKIHSLNEELKMLHDNNGLLVKDLDKIRDKNYVLEQRLQREAVERGGVELQRRDCEKERGQQRILLKESANELQSKVQAYDVLNRQLTETKEALEVKERELTKAVEEAQRYHDLYETGNVKLTDVRNAYENLRKLVQAEATKAEELKVAGLKGGHLGNIAETVVRREAAGEAVPTVERQNNAAPVQNVAGIAREEPKQEGSPADKTKPSGQEQNVNKPTEERKPQQQHKKEERAAQEAEKDKEKKGEKEEGRVKAEEEGKDGGQEKEDEREMEIQRAEGSDGDGVNEDGEKGVVGENEREKRRRRSVRKERINKMKSMKESVKRRGA